MSFLESDLFGSLVPPSRSEGVHSPAPAQVAVNRIRTLLLTVPLHNLHRNRSLRSDIGRIDVRSLALVALDLAIEGMGLSEGITRRELVERLGGFSQHFTGEAVDGAFSEACEFVVDGLVNAPRSEVFREEYLAMEAEGTSLRDFEFRLLQEEEREGRVVIRATKYAINLCLRMLETEIEDAQIANEAVLEDQLRRGAIDRAAQSAQQGKLLSMGLQEKIDGLVNRLRRDVRQVDYLSDLKPRLDDARRHLEGRSATSERLLDIVEERLDEARGDAGRELARLREGLRDCRGRHASLLERVMRATRDFLDEQERQSFRRARSGRLPAMESDVLRPALRISSRPMEGMAGEVISLLHAAAPPLVLSLRSLVDGCLAPRRQSQGVEALVDDSVPEEVAPPLARWSGEEQSRIDSWLGARVSGAGEGGVRLSGLVAEAESEGWPSGRIHLLGLKVLCSMESGEKAGERGGSMVARRSGSEFHASVLEGDDLVIGWEEDEE